MGSRIKSSNSTDPRGVDDDAPEDSEAKPDAAEEDRFITIRKWAPAKSQDKPDPKYLADRRAGLPPLYGAVGPAEVVMPAKKLVKVRTTDPVTGQQRIYDTMILEGGESTVDGEIITEEEAAAALAAATANETANTDSAVPIVVTEAPAPGTVVEGVGVVNEQGVVVATAVTAAAAAVVEATPVRRRPPPPKRKKHGPGRGKKKIVVAPGQGIDVPGSGLRYGEVATPATDGGAQTGSATGATTPMNLDGAGDEREGSQAQQDGDDNEESGDEEGSEEGEIEEQGDDATAPAEAGVESVVENVESTQAPPVARVDEPSVITTTILPPDVSISAPDPDVDMTDSFAATKNVEPMDNTVSPTEQATSALSPASSLPPVQLKDPYNGPLDSTTVGDTPIIGESSAPETIAKTEEEPSATSASVTAPIEEVPAPIEPAAEPATEVQPHIGVVEEAAVPPPTEEVSASTVVPLAEDPTIAPPPAVADEAPVVPSPPPSAISPIPVPVEEPSAPVAEPIPEPTSAPSPAAAVASPSASASAEVDLLGNLEKTLDDE